MGTDKGWHFCGGIVTHYNNSIDAALKNIYPNKTFKVVNVSALKPVWVLQPKSNSWSIDHIVVTIPYKSIIFNRALTLPDDKDLMADVLFFAEELFK